MNAGIGFSFAKEGAKSAIEIAEQIRKTSVPTGENEILLVFCNAGVDYAALHTQLRDEFGNTPIVGGGVIGVITNYHYEYTNSVSGAMLIQGRDLKVRYGSTDFNRNEIEAGERLISQIGVEKNDKALMIFFETTAVEASDGHPPELNNSTWLCDGIYNKMPQTILLAGAGLVWDLSFGKSVQFCGDIICKDSVLGVMFGGAIKAYSQVFHGCTPLDGIYHTITKINNGVIEELDGKPVVAMIDDLFKDKRWRSEHPLQLLSLGINKGERFSEFLETNYVNRLILGISPDKKGIVPIKPDFREGDEIQFMLRDNNRMIETAGRGAKMLMDRISSENKKPHFAFYINCAGRAAKNCNSLKEEVVEVQRVINDYHVPLLGIYSGVEIAPYSNRSIGLDWTGVLFVVAEG